VHKASNWGSGVVIESQSLSFYEKWNFSIELNGSFRVPRPPGPIENACIQLISLKSPAPTARFSCFTVLIAAFYSYKLLNLYWLSQESIVPLQKCPISAFIRRSNAKEGGWPRTGVVWLRKKGGWGVGLTIWHCLWCLPECLKFFSQRRDRPPCTALDTHQAFKGRFLVAISWTHMLVNEVNFLLARSEIY
jgi:hypothetical protein